MLSISTLNKVLKLHIILKSTMDKNNKNNSNAFSFNLSIIEAFEIS
jgi:hypothetical protein